MNLNIATLLIATLSFASGSNLRGRELLNDQESMIVEAPKIQRKLKSSSSSTSGSGSSRSGSKSGSSSSSSSSSSGRSGSSGSRGFNYSRCGTIVIVLDSGTSRSVCEDVAFTLDNDVMCMGEASGTYIQDNDTVITGRTADTLDDLLRQIESGCRNAVSSSSSRSGSSSSSSSSSSSGSGSRSGSDRSGSGSGSGSASGSDRSAGSAGSAASGSAGTGNSRD